MASSTPKDWRNATAHDGGGDTSTPLSAVALEDLESRVMPPWFNVTHYGAVGDGATDDTAEIQEALDAAAAEDGTVYVPAGIYRVSSLSIDSGVRLYGAGMGLSVIKANNTTVVLQNEHPTTGDDNIEVRDLTFHGNDATLDFIVRFDASTATFPAGNSDITVRNVEVCNGDYAGLFIQKCIRGRVIDCYIHTLERDGVQFADGKDLLVRGCTIQDTHDDSVAFVAYTAQIVRASAVGNDLGDDSVTIGTGANTCVLFAGVRGGVCAGNVIRGAIDGITVQNFNAFESQGIAITGNSLERPGIAQAAGGTGILIAGGQTRGGTADAGIGDITISGNTIVSPWSEGIRVTAGNGHICNKVIIANNMIAERTGEGIGTAQGISVRSYTSGDLIRDVIISGNYIHRMESDGIFVDAQANGNVSRLVITGNTITDSDTNGILIDGGAVGAVDIVLIQGNMITNTTGGTRQDYGIQFTGSAAGRVSMLDNHLAGNNTADTLGAPITDIASAATITIPSAATTFNVTGTTTITSVTASNPGRVVTLKFAGILTFTDGSNLKLNGNFVTSADDTITLTCDGTNWYEMARSAN
jgi:hypothetical protein